ncbi:MAG TPA: MFS transporter [Thermoleophilaceae bacterium]|jgi:MFS family permease|nr:MFS transporter [Thermoleophilaceae bacterium]
MRESLRALRLPGLARLAGTLTLAELGETLASLALAVVVFGRSGSVLATGAFFVAARLGPAFASQPLAAFIDRRAGRRGLAICLAIEAVLFAVLAAPLPVAVLVVVPLVTGTLAVCCRSVTRAEATVRLTRAGQLRAGNSALNLGFAVAGTVGAAVGGGLAALTTPALPLFAAAACFAVGAVLMVRTPRARPEAEAANAWAHFRQGLRAARSDRLAFTLIAVQTAALLAFMLVIPIEVVYAERDLGVGAGGYGALLATWGLGIVVGGALFARARSPLLLLAATASLLVAVAYFGLAVAPGLVFACAASLLGGIGNGIQWVAVITALQERVPEALQVRVVGLLDAGAQLAPGLGFVVGSVLTALLSARATYAIAGAATTVAAMAFFYMHARAARRYAVVL